MKYIIINIFVAIFLYLLDTFYFNQGIFSLLLGFLVISVFLILTVIALVRKNKYLVMTRIAVIVIYILMIIAVSGSTRFFNNLALTRAEKLIKACNDYRVKYEKFPDKLEDLAPEFIPSIPSAKPVFFEPKFNYISEKDNHVIWYVVLPPFYRAFYCLEKGTWSYLD
jgi:hypothetical protein